MVEDANSSESSLSEDFGMNSCLRFKVSVKDCDIFYRQESEDLA